MFLATALLIVVAITIVFRARLKNITHVLVTGIRLWVADRLLPQGYVVAHYQITQDHIEGQVEEARLEGARAASVKSFMAGYRAAKAGLEYEVAKNGRKVVVGKRLAQGSKLVTLFWFDTAKCEIKDTGYAAKKTANTVQKQAAYQEQPDMGPLPNYEELAANVLP